MTQSATIFTRTGTVQLEIPSPDEFLLDNVQWGSVDAFPTPAYWQCQVIARKIGACSVRYRLGRTLAEEAAACLLGGHGVPASVGLAAFERLHKLGAFSGEAPSEKQLEEWLREPLRVQQRQVRYRFAAQKARYLACAIPLTRSAPAFATGKQLRDWLIRLPGFGPKTASWVARNWMDADDVAILDIHIMRVGQAMGLFPETLTVDRHYLELEELFLQFSQALDVRASELDAVIWYEMASSPTTARLIRGRLPGAPTATRNRRSTRAKGQRELSSS